MITHAVRSLWFRRRHASRLSLLLVSSVVIAGCSDSPTAAPGDNASFELQLVDNGGLPALLFTKLGGQIHLTEATLEPHEAGKMREVRVLRESSASGDTFVRDSSIVDVQVSGNRYIFTRPHPNPALVRVDTGRVEGELLIVPTTLDYRVSMGVALKRVDLKYTEKR